MAAFALICAIGAQIAVGQGTSGNFADPLGIMELSQLLEQTGADPRPVWPAIEALHTKYLEDCASLRSARIERVQARGRELFASGIQSPANAAEVERWTREWLSARRTAAKLDEALFDAVREAMPVATHERVARARAARERAALLVAVARGLAAESVTIDLASLFRGIDSESPQAEAIRAECELALADYDARQGRAVREYTEAAANGLVAYYKAIESEPRPDLENGDDEEIAAFMERSKAAMGRAFEPASRIGRTLRGSNVRAFEAVRAVLALRDPVWERRLRLAYLVSAYPSIREGESFGVEAIALKALRLKLLGEAERHAIRQEFAQWRVADDRLIAEQVTQENAHSDFASDHVGSVDEEESAAYSSKVEAILTRRSTAAEEAIARIEGVAGPNARALFAKCGTHEEGEHFLGEGEVFLVAAATAAVEAPRTEAAVVREPMAVAGETLFRARPMGVEWTDRIVRSLGLAEAQRAIVEALMADYREAWERDIGERMSEVESVAAISARLASSGEGDGRPVPSEESVLAMVTAGASLRRAQRELDDRLFGDLEAVLGDTTRGQVVTLLRCARDSGDRIPELDAVFDGRTGGEENSNVALSLTSVKLSPEECAKAAAALAPSIEGLTRTAHGVESALSALWRDRATNELMIASLAKLNDTSLWAQAQREAKKRTDAVRGAGAAAAQAKASAQRKALDAVLAVLSQSARKVVEASYLRDAYLAAYEESEPASEALDRAFALADLTDAQRTSLAIARDEYRAGRDAAVQLMVKVMQADATSTPGAKGESTAAETWGHIEDLQRYAFARDAARDALLMKLRTTLSPEQLLTTGIK